MNWIAEFRRISYLEVLVAAISSFALGLGWYHWDVFGKSWAGLLGLTKAEADNTEGLGMTFVAAVVGSFLAATFLSILMSATATDGLLKGALFGALTGVALRLTSLLYHNGFSRQPVELTMINGSYDIVQLAIIGAIVGFFL